MGWSREQMLKGISKETPTDKKRRTTIVIESYDNLKGLVWLARMAV